VIADIAVIGKPKPLTTQGRNTKEIARSAKIAKIAEIENPANQTGLAGYPELETQTRTHH